ncbi:hypothetical protein GCM10010306_026630 [Streptomyces umbrinus]|nr:hypothetical protein [Streptomyces umbrinus]GHB32115.1 hypothetical protein GCM10010306_026630 [Streptomyces umbrinus]
MDILYGVLVAVSLSVAELLTRVARPHHAVEGLVPGPGKAACTTPPRHAPSPGPGLLVHRYDSPLFFTDAEDFRRRRAPAVDEQDGPVRWFVVGRGHFRGRHHGRGRRKDLRDDLNAYGPTESVGTGPTFLTLSSAVAAYRSWCRTRVDAQ